MTSSASVVAIGQKPLVVDLRTLYSEISNGQRSQPSDDEVINIFLDQPAEEVEDAVAVLREFFPSAHKELCRRVRELESQSHKTASTTGDHQPYRGVHGS